ncbi:uncharacterized protein YjbI with pentapeptide repeats [Pseudomonas sp. SLBN-26]|uniref:ion channel n=1 Tax=Pseudomonadaceae TaxID=135621 RepID=UPI0011752B9A|nr:MULTISPECIES: ion channel [Pseudomonas]MCP1618077.1 uncharacterized protein YjbI with pentapeptide repeats [Pseudomonas otitidis]TQL07315.1 uncharacterized protein YjbI with pentapeptide repeats [Pseudomonas sp. SLBN-26]
MRAYIHTTKLHPIFKKHGWDGVTPIGDYWFTNFQELAPIIEKKYPNHSQMVSTQLRWMTTKGLECHKQLLQFIEEFKTQTQAHMNQQYLLLQQVRNNPTILNWPSLDFANFRFEIDGEHYSLSDFQEMYNNSKIYPTQNLSGIDLKGLSLQHVSIRNVSFFYANLEGASFHQVIFEDVTFNQAYLASSNIQAGEWTRTSLSSADLSAAKLNAVSLKDETINLGFKYSEVSQFYLLKTLARALFKEGATHDDYFAPQKHTVFLANNTNEITSNSATNCKNYIDWYQYVLGNIRNIRNLTPSEKTRFILSMIFTKCWHSYAVLGLMSALVMLIYSLAYAALPSTDFGGTGINGLFDALYFSVVTFTTLGYGEIHPLGLLARLIVILEVISGYVLLGSFVFLIGHKVSSRY